MMARLVLAGLLVSTVLLPALTASADKDDRFMARLVARSFFRALQDEEVPALLPLCASRVSFDGRWVSGTEALRTALASLAARAKEQRLRLRQVEVLTYAEAVKRFGPPPARLKDAIRPGQMIALGAFQRGGLVAALAKSGPFYRITALSD